MRFDDDGIHIHQSDLKNHCLEKLRLDTVAVGPRVENDAATVGTVLHAVIEHELLGDPYESLDDCKSYAAWAYVHQLDEYKEQQRPYAMSSFNTHDRALDMLIGLAEAWYRSTEREMLLTAAERPHVEWNFDIPFRHVSVKKHGKKAEDIPVYLAGTADILLPDRSQIWDWKTAGSEYRRWEYQRWGRQPDVYTWAAAHQGLLAPNADGLYEFQFKVFVRGAAPVDGCQTVTIFRSDNSWNWLGEIVDRLVNFSYNMGMDRSWPLDDQHVLCSPKWCTFFDMCKGSMIDAERWV